MAVVAEASGPTESTSVEPMRLAPPAHGIRGLQPSAPPIGNRRKRGVEALPVCQCLSIVGGNARRQQHMGLDQILVILDGEPYALAGSTGVTHEHDIADALVLQPSDPHSNLIYRIGVPIGAGYRTVVESMTVVDPKAESDCECAAALVQKSLLQTFDQLQSIVGLGPMGNHDYAIR